MRFTTTIPAALLSLSVLVHASPLGGLGLGLGLGLMERGTSDMRCGSAGGGKTCASTPGNACCSVNSWCGDTAGHCGTGCQPGYGRCDGVTGGGGGTTPTPPATGGTSTTTCGNIGAGANGGLSCANSLCCSINGWCGATTGHCGVGTGCQTAFGRCDGATGGGTTTTTTTTPPASTPPAGALIGSSTTTCGNMGAGAGGGLICASGLCCSVNGWCNNTPAHCGAGCQTAFGRCDSAGGGTTTPTTPTTPGGSTANVPRPRLGSGSYGGAGIWDCVTPGTATLTFDDGPYIYTSSFLDYLASQGVVATFFVTGNNIDKGAIDDMSRPWAAMIRRMDSDGHQICSHTWTHRDLSTLSEDERRNEMYRNEQALVAIIGKFPTYMRPPYSSCTAACQATMATLGYHIIYYDLDTDDYNNLSNMQPSKDRVTNSLAGTSSASTNWLTIAHDTHSQTTTDLVPFMISAFRSRGYRFVTLGECLGDPKANWYRTP